VRTWRHVLHPAFAAMLVLSAAGASAAGPESDGIEEIGEIEEVEVHEDGSGAYDEGNFPALERGTNLLLARTTRRHAFLFVVDHRTWQPARDEPFHDLLGFDRGALKIGLGLRFGITDDLDVGAYRLNNGTEAFDSYDFDLRYLLLDQERFLFDLGLRAGVTWFSQLDADDAAGPFVQLLVDHELRHQLTIASGLLFHGESTGDRKSDEDKAWSLAVPLLVEARLTPWLAWNLETVLNVAGYGAAHPVFTSSLKILTARHTFSLVASTTQYIGADGLPAGTRRSLDEMIVGFTITRELGL
jgi:hypothetical protein